MELIKKFIDLVLHLDRHLDAMIQTFGPRLYVILFLIIFCETGLVVTPILPGDSLLFAVGALSARPDGLNLGLALTLLSVAAILGDTVNYWIGAYTGPMYGAEDASTIHVSEAVIATQVDTFIEVFSAGRVTRHAEARSA